MAWIDDRAWCHPKLVDLSAEAFRVWVHGIAYSSGFSTGGVLSAGQQRTIGTNESIRGELLEAGLWHAQSPSSVLIHDWQDHNGKRDERRKADRERKRAAREAERELPLETLSAGTSAGQSAGSSNGLSAGPAHVDRVTDDRVKEVKERPKPLRIPDPIWDWLCSLQGQPLERQQRAWGRIVSDLRMLLRRDGYSGSDQVPELNRRRAALARSWGDEGKATPRALVENWAWAAHVAEASPPDSPAAREQARLDGLQRLKVERGIA